MGELVPPVGDGNDDPPLHPSPKHPRPSSPEKPSETYVVQIPRDQVYRVPAPENSHISDNYQSPSRDNKNRCGGRWTLIFLAIMLVGFGIFVTIHILAKPKSPEFSVIHFHKKNLKASNHHSSVPEYEILLQVDNPNQNMEVHYGVGNVTLSFKGHKIASGGYPLLQQEAGKPIKVDETLYGRKEALPGWVARSMNGTSPKSLILNIDVPIEIETWGKDLKKELIVGCDLQVNTLGEGAKILSQNCGTDF
ncbi:NDR1/HIN1-like protein 13 [Coffea eugenioides]|uniref:NDR1/HIN1-like protein 13 n=1 Tax=Coffea eugenioides TaxID=49369 RepID=UPI000F612BD2|nr:NDR1/HIN1-like protein 13 [Coffea eugenioides]